MTPRTPPSSERPSASRFASVAALAALAVWMLAPMTGAHIEHTSGRVEIGSGEPPVWRAAHDGDALTPGAVVRTGRDGRAELVLPAGSVRLYGDSLMRIPAGAPKAGSADGVELEAGSSLFDVLHRGRNLFEVRTPEVVVSIKGTRFLVVAGNHAEVAVFRGSVGVRPVLDPVRELLVHEGFAAVGSSSHPFDLRWSGAPDPWEAWQGGALPPAAPEPAGAGASTLESTLEAAKAAADAESKREAVAAAIERYPDVAERVEKAIAEHAGKEAKLADDAVPAAPAPDVATHGHGKSGKGGVEELYVEAVLNGGGQGQGQGQGGGGDPGFAVTVVDDSVVVTQSGQSWTLSEDVLEAVVDGDASLPVPLVNAIDAQGAKEKQFAKKLLKLLD